jgi:hypothetical protein
MTTKASTAQAWFIKAILKHGGYQVPGSKVFGKRDDRSRNAIKIQTIESCKKRKWVIREEVGGNALWTVTVAGRDAAIEPLPIGEKTKNLVNELERQRVENTA